ncbi:MAG: hypothetical protein KDA20_10985 [Phycisphaerales bacterium]|nr:hypothetical protein [Phycisphaerales bacterium]
MTNTLRTKRSRTTTRGTIACLALVGIATTALAANELVVIAYNDLGMHCMDEDFSELIILPPFNTIRAQVIERHGSPQILEDAENLTLRFSLPANTRSADKTNFWSQVEAAFGVALPPDIGLTGNGLSGEMERGPGGGAKYWEVVGIPVTPFEDNGRINPYPLAQIDVEHADGRTGQTVTVVPVSTELSCNLCHSATDGSANLDVLRDHDALHGTDLVNQRPVLCASCHADNALGAPGQPGLPALSHAIHGAHADRMHLVDGIVDNACYACHPGIRTSCHRGRHQVNGVDCIACHGDMADVGNPTRNPWVDLPRCGDCHTRPGFEFEQPGVLYKDSVGHGGVMCVSCHGSPHVILPSGAEADNQQSLLLQGKTGILDTCTTCHTSMPSDPFPHRRDD